MSGDGILGMGSASGNAATEAYALTDEQILGMEGEEAAGDQGPASGEEKKDLNAEAPFAKVAQDKRRAQSSEGMRVQADGAVRSRGSQAGESLTPEGVSYTAPPKWLAREMNDPWVGDEARELWDSAQSAQREAAGYREMIGSPEEARALREIYPGGVAEARSAAERAQELAEIDATIFGAPGRGAEELRAGRAQLVERLYAQDPGAFRELVEAGVRLLERDRQQSARPLGMGQDAMNLPGSLHSVAGAPSIGAEEKAGHSGRDDRSRRVVPVPQEVVSAYREFERAANEELERSVGGTIGRALESALPNLRRTGGSTGGEGFVREGSLADRGKQASSLPERLQAAVKEEVEAALRSDGALGEQVARVLSGKRFDGAARAQVVRLIDARAQQLVPGAVKKVVGSWTAATLGPKSPDARGEREKTIVPAKGVTEMPQNERANGRDSGRRPPRGRVDYRKWSDEQILEM